MNFVNEGVMINATPLRNKIPFRSQAITYFIRD